MYSQLNMRACSEGTRWAPTIVIHGVTFKERPHIYIYIYIILYIYISKYIAQVCPDWDTIGISSICPKYCCFSIEPLEVLPSASAQLHSLYRAWTILVSTFFVAGFLGGWLRERTVAVVYVFDVSLHPKCTNASHITRWWFQNVSNKFNLHPYLEKIPILTNIFQMGWNHQVDNLFISLVWGLLIKLGPHNIELGPHNIQLIKLTVSTAAPQSVESWLNAGVILYNSQEMLFTPLLTPKKDQTKIQPMKNPQPPPPPSPKKKTTTCQKKTTK